MARTQFVIGVALGAALLSHACGSLNSGEVIVDGGGSGGANGGASASGGSAGRAYSGSAGSEPEAAGAGGSAIPEGGRAAGGNGAGGSGAGGRRQGGGGGSSKGGSSSAGAVGAAGQAGAGAAGGESGVSCSESKECPADTPICEGGACRPCALASECKVRDAAAPLCQAGECVACQKNDDCATASAPICGKDFSCHGCREHSECSSLACDRASGACVPTTQVAYALPLTGSTASDCGTQGKPCYSLSTAASKLSAQRPYLVLITTTQSFNTGAVLPTNLNTHVIGNRVRIAPYDGAAAFTISGGSVSIEDVVVEEALPDSASTSSAIICVGGATLRLSGSSITGAKYGLSLNDCALNLGTSVLSKSTYAIDSICPTAGCTTNIKDPLRIERTRFDANQYALHTTRANYFIRNNLFTGNGNVAYTRVIYLEANGTFAYNTLVANDNACSYVGIVTCTVNGGCGTLSSNLSWGNFPKASCPDQVYYPTGTTMTNSLSETVWPGTGNVTGDPLFIGKGDAYTPGPGSPARDKGSSDAGLMPSVDFYGRPRPVGSGPDIGAVEAQ